MKKSILVVVAVMFLMAGALYAAASINPVSNEGSVELREVPDKDPKAKGDKDKKVSKDAKATDAKAGCCSSADKSAKAGEAGKCDTASKASADKAGGCGSKDKAESGSSTKGGTPTAAADRTNCSRTKCQ